MPGPNEVEHRELSEPELEALAADAASYEQSLDTSDLRRVDRAGDRAESESGVSESRFQNALNRIRHLESKLDQGTGQGTGQPEK